MNIRDYVNDDDDNDDDNDNDNNNNDDDSSSENSSEFDIRKVFDNSTKSVRGALDEHIVSKVGTASKSFQDVLDNKVAPHIQTVRRTSMETITTLQKKINIDSSLEDVKQRSIRTIESVKDDTNKFIDTVKQSSNNTIHTIQHQTTKTIQKLENEVTNNLKPKITKLMDKTHKGMVTKTNQFQSWIKSVIHIITITYLPYYWGTAPGVRNNNNNNNNENNNNDDTWYWYYWLVLVIIQEGSFRAFSKVLFCDNPITGIFIWFGILYSSPLAGFCSMIGVVTVRIE